MVNRAIIETARKFLEQIPQEMLLKKAFLFGSQASGNAHEDSDIDIALIVGKMDNFFQTQMQLMRLRRLVDLRIEPHPILESDFNIQNPFAYEVQRKGIEL